MRDMDWKRQLDRERIRRMAAAAKAHPDTTAALRRRVSELEKNLRSADAELVARRIADEEREALRRAVANVDVPRWMVKGAAPTRGPGVPSLMLTDWHTGEVVRPERIAGKNAYNRLIQQERVKRLIAGAIDLTKRHMVRPEYPGIVVPLGGDMVSGYIHEELTVTNWGDARECVREAARLLIWCFERLSDEFDFIFAPAVTGNHGRLTKKMEAKRRVGTSLDAMIYDRVAEFFANRKNIRFAIAEGTAVLYSVFGHRYLLTHGDPGSLGVKGGDGIIGALGPIVRGAKKLLARNSQLDMDFDTLVLGHYHQHVVMNGVIVGGSIKGYDEYAWSGGFPYEDPTQPLWFTHPERGVTCHWPVHVEEKGAKPAGDWVSLFTE